MVLTVLSTSLIISKGICATGAERLWSRRLFFSKRFSSKVVLLLEQYYLKSHRLRMASES